jgi:hypothetical protein
LHEVDRRRALRPPRTTAKPGDEGEAEQQGGDACQDAAGGQVACGGGEMIGLNFAPALFDLRGRRHPLVAVRCEWLNRFRRPFDQLLSLRDVRGRLG